MGRAPARHPGRGQGCIRVLPPRRRRLERALGAATPRRARMISRDLVTWLVVAGGVTFIVFANVAQQRAIGRRRPTVRLATGVAQWLPYFLWVPYVVVGARIGPELD